MLIDEWKAILIDMQIDKNDFNRRVALGYLLQERGHASGQRDSVLRRSTSWTDCSLHMCTASVVQFLFKQNIQTQFHTPKSRSDCRKTHTRVCARR